MKEVINFLTWLNENDRTKNIIQEKENVYKKSKGTSKKVFEVFIKEEIIPIAKANGFNFDAKDYFNFISKNKSKLLNDEELEYVSGGKKLFVPAILMAMINIGQIGMSATTYAVPPKPSIDSEEKTEQIIESTKNELLEEFNGIDQSLKWKLIMDGRIHKYNDPNLFDNGGKGAYCEPGYKDAMIGALDYTFSEECMNKRFDADLYLELHEKACHNVENLRTQGQNDFRKATVQTGFRLEKGTNISEEGKKQFEDKKDSLWKSDKLFVYNNENELDLALGTLGICMVMGTTFYAPFPETDDSIKNAVNLIFDEYYAKLQELDNNGHVIGSLLPDEASLEDKKLEIIIRICQNLDQLHAWQDGNIRTITFLVMQRMLIENGLTPAIFRDPNCIDVRSVQEIIPDLRQGQEIYKKIVEESKAIKQ